MGFTDFLFGEGPSQTITPTSTLTPEQEALLRELLTLLGGSFTGDPLAAPPIGEGVGVSPLEETALGGLENIAGQLTGGMGRPLNVAANEALMELFGRGPQDFDEVFTRTVQQPLLEDFDQIIEQAIPARFVGQLSGGEARQAGDRAREDLFDTLARERSRFAYESQNQYQQDLLRGLGLAGSVGSLDINQLNAILQGAGVQREGAQATLDERFRRLQELISLIGIDAFENIVFNSPGSEGFISSLLGSGSDIADLYETFGPKKEG